MILLVLLMLIPFLKAIVYVDLFGQAAILNIAIVLVSVIALVYAMAAVKPCTLRIGPFYTAMICFCFVVVPFGFLDGSQGMIETVSNYASAFYHVTFCVVTGILLKRNPRVVIHIWSLVLNTLAIINVLTVFLFPQGLYSTGYGNYLTLHWFLGYDNAHVHIYLIALMLAVLDSYLKGGKIVNRYIVVLWLAFMAASIYRWTATSMISLLLVGLLLFGYKFLLKYDFIFNIRTYILATAVFSFLFVVIATNASGDNVISQIVTGFLQKDVTFNSRGYIWASFLNAISASPLFGYGYQSLAEMQTVTGFSGAHNEWIQMLYDGGIVHFCFFVTMLVFIVKRLRNCSDRNLSYAIAAILLGVFVIQSMVEFRQICWMLLFVFAYHSELFVVARSKESDLTVKSKKIKTSGIRE